MILGGMERKFVGLVEASERADRRVDRAGTKQCLADSPVARELAVLEARIERRRRLNRDCVCCRSLKQHAGDRGEDRVAPDVNLVRVSVAERYIGRAVGGRYTSI
jgi:hypothetical protein